MEAILGIASMIFVELTILVLAPSKGSLDLPRPLYEVFILDLHKHLGNWGAKGRQLKARPTRWGTRTSYINLPSGISFRSFVPYLAPIFNSLGVKFLSLVVLSSSPSRLGLSQFFCFDVLVGLTLEC